MRRPFIAGNWKMNLNRAEAAALAKAVAVRAQDYPAVELAVFPPSVYIDAVREAVSGTPLGYGAQNVYPEPNGAFTGEISTAMLLDLGCKYVILGHSERRHILGETDADVNKKVLAALAAGLIPIVCVGELLAEREAGKTNDVIRRQFDGSLAGLSAEQMGRLVIAYEPVWAIGTGKVATPEQAEEVHRELRKIITDRYNAAIAQAVRIQYGGSVKASNAAELLAQENVDGALVGGASLKAEEFLGIVAAAGQVGQ
jgi:triosephosphate isomerase